MKGEVGGWGSRATQNKKRVYAEALYMKGEGVGGGGGVTRNDKKTSRYRRIIYDEQTSKHRNLTRRC